MNQMDREGIFRAQASDWVVRPPKEGSNVVMVGMRFDVLAQKDGAEWVDWSGYDTECYGNFCLIKKDGHLNENVAEQFRDILGWDGDLEFAGFQPPACQIVVKQDDYEGQTRFKADYIRAFDDEGGAMREASGEDTNALKARYGSKLRAYFGANVKTSGPGAKPVGKPAPKSAPAKPAATPPPATKPEAPAAPAAPVGTSSREKSWAAFVEQRARVNPNQSDEELATIWRAAIAATNPDKHETELTPEEWYRVDQKAASYIHPPAEPAAPASGEDIPF